MEWQYEVVVRRTLETGEVVPCIINSLTGQVSCEDPSICVDPSEETATGTTINQVFFKCRASFVNFFNFLALLNVSGEYV
jgi:hypothetical protein